MWVDPEYGMIIYDTQIISFVKILDVVSTNADLE